PNAALTTHSQSTAGAAHTPPAPRARTVAAEPERPRFRRAEQPFAEVPAGAARGRRGSPPREPEGRSGVRSQGLCCRRLSPAAVVHLCPCPVKRLRFPYAPARSLPARPVGLPPLPMHDAHP